MIDRYMELRAEVARLDAEAKPLKAEIAELEGAIVAQWTADGTSKLTRDGKTIYLRRELSVKHKQGTAATVAVLRELGLADLLQASPQRLKAWLKEQMHREDIDEWDTGRMPDTLAEYLDVNEYTKLGMRAG